jgi:hypothetical protein
MLYRMNSSAPFKGRTLRAVKGIAVVTLVAIFTMALGGPRSIASLWAQTAANPLIAPVPPPAAPSQLPAPITTAIAPILQPVPTLPIASPTPSLRAFNCSCFGRATATNWMGQVSAQGYFAARQAAVGACLSYNERRAPQPPVMTSRGSTTAAGANSVPILPGAAIGGGASQVGQSLPGTLDLSTAQQLQRCSNCVCN